MIRKLLALILLFAVAFGITLVVLRWQGGRGRGETDSLVIQVEEAREIVAGLTGRGVRTRAADLNLETEQIRALLLVELSDTSVGQRLLAGSRELRVDLYDDRMEVGLVLAVARIEESLAGLGGADVERVLRLISLIPGGEVFLGIRGEPTAHAGRLGLEGETLELVLGPLSLPVEDIESRVGVTASELSRRLVLAVGDLDLESARVADGRLVLQVRPGS